MIVPQRGKIRALSNPMIEALNGRFPVQFCQ